MSYRTDVYGKFLKQYENYFSEICDRYEIDYFETDTDDEYFYFKGEYLRWYSDFSDVIAICDFIESLGNDGGIITLGEDGAYGEVGQPYEVGMEIYTRIEGMII